MAEKGKCYIYGSIHTKKPEENDIRDWISKADYVLLEGFNDRNSRSVLRKWPYAILVILGIKLYFLTIGKFYKDMKYVKHIATEMSKKVEIMDSSLTEVFSSDLVNLKKPLFACYIVECITILGIVPFILSLPTIDIVLAIFIFLAIIYAIPIACASLFVNKINALFRDSKVIEMTRELLEKGYNVFIFRGKEHLKFVTEELHMKYSISCEVLS